MRILCVGGWGVSVWRWGRKASIHEMFPITKCLTTSHVKFCFGLNNSYWSYLWSPESLDQKTLQPQPCYKLALWNSCTLNQTLNLKKMKKSLEIWKVKNSTPKVWVWTFKQTFFPPWNYLLTQEEYKFMLTEW